MTKDPWLVKPADMPEKNVSQYLMAHTVYIVHWEDKWVSFAIVKLWFTFIEAGVFWLLDGFPCTTNVKLFLCLKEALPVWEV